MIELNEEQRRNLQSGRPVEVTDTDAVGDCVLMLKDVFERVKRLAYDDSEWGDEETLLLLAQSSTANGWDEPNMEEYDRYDEERRKRCP